LNRDENDYHYHIRCGGHLGPVRTHGRRRPRLVRPAADQIPEIDLPDVDQACVFADAFLRAVAT
jgi:hypothetical protein